MDDANDLQQILLDDSPLRRAYAILQRLCRSLGIEETQKIPYELVAQMVSVTPKEVATIWQRYRARQERKKYHLRPSARVMVSAAV